MRATNHLRRCGKALCAILAVGLFTALLYGLLAAPGLLIDSASSVPVQHTSRDSSMLGQVAQ